MKRYRALGALSLLLVCAAVAFAQEQQCLYNIIVLTRLDFASGVLTSARLATGLSDETGSAGGFVRATGATITSATLTTPLFTAFTEDTTATNVIAAAESGSTFYLNSATEFISTLPAPAAGLRFTFIVVAAPASASYTIVTTTSTNIIKGKLLTAQDAGGSGDTGTADDTITFVDGQAVAGDRCEIYSDGTSYFADCFSKVLAGVTFTQAS